MKRVIAVVNLLLVGMVIGDAALLLDKPQYMMSRKYGHKLPKSNVKPCFPTLEDIPSGVFRCTEGECLGLGAGKNCYYQNPEYFSFHHMSFFDFHVHLKGRRMLQPDSKRKPP